MTVTHTVELVTQSLRGTCAIVSPEVVVTHITALWKSRSHICGHQRWSSSECRAGIHRIQCCTVKSASDWYPLPGPTSTLSQGAHLRYHDQGHARLHARNGRLDPDLPLASSPNPPSGCFRSRSVKQAKPQQPAHPRRPPPVPRPHPLRILWTVFPRPWQ